MVGAGDEGMERARVAPPVANEAWAIGAGEELAECRGDEEEVVEEADRRNGVWNQVERERHVRDDRRDQRLVRSGEAAVPEQPVEEPDEAR